MGINRDSPTEATDGATPVLLSPAALNAALDLWSQAGEQHYLPIRGRSMLPLLREGDDVLVAHTRDLYPGEIAVFQQPGGLVAHRVLAVFTVGGEQILRTKGDNTLGVDPPARSNQIVGRAVNIRRGGRIIDIYAPGWRRIGKVLAFLMKTQACIYYRSLNLTPGRDLPPPSRLSTWASRVLLLGIAFFLRAFQSFFGSWRAE